MATSVQRPLRVTRLWQAGVLAAVFGAFLNLGIYLIARALGTSFVVQPPGREPAEVSAAGVVLITVVPLLVGAAVYGALRKVTRRPFPAFAVLAAVVFLLSLVPPLTAALRVSTAIVLILMHVVATAVLLVTLYVYERSTFR